jgi:hypothetical protein
VPVQLMSMLPGLRVCVSIFLEEDLQINPYIIAQKAISAHRQSLPEVLNIF